MKKTIAFVLAVCMIFVSAPSVWASNESNTIYCEALNATAGERLDVPIMVKNNTGLMGTSIEIAYDKTAITPVSVTRGDILSEGMFDDNISNATPGSFKAVWTGSENITENGTLFTVTFAVSGTAEGSGTIGLSYVQADTFNEDWEDVVLNCEDISVSFSNAAADNSPRFYSDATAATAGAEFTLPIMLDNTCNMTEFSIELKYDSSLFTYASLEDGSITASNVLTGVNGDTGTLSLSWSGNEITQSGTLLSVIFNTREYAQEQSTINISCSNAVFDGNETLDAMCENAVINVTNPHASEPAELYCSVQAAAVGETVDIPVYMRNNHGIMGFGILVEYDESVLTPVSASRGNVIGTNGNFDDSIGTNEQSFKVIWNHSENINKNGLLLTLRFTVNSEATANSTTVSLRCLEEDTYNEKWETVSLNAQAVTTQIDRLCITAASSQMYVGGTLRLSASYLYNTKTVGAVQWTSDDSSIVSINENGLVTANAAGRATISVTTADGNETATYVITAYEVVVCQHRRAYTVAGTAATCTTGGYTDGVYCPDCDTWCSKRTATPALGHTDANRDDVCDVCDLLLDGSNNNSSSSFFAKIIALFLLVIEWLNKLRGTTKTIVKAIN